MGWGWGLLLELGSVLVSSSGAAHYKMVQQNSYVGSLLAMVLLGSGAEFRVELRLGFRRLGSKGLGSGFQLMLELGFGLGLGLGFGFWVRVGCWVGVRRVRSREWRMTLSIPSLKDIENIS